MFTYQTTQFTAVIPTYIQLTPAHHTSTPIHTSIPILHTRALQAFLSYSLISSIHTLHPSMATSTHNHKEFPLSHESHSLTELLLLSPPTAYSKYPHSQSRNFLSLTDLTHSPNSSFSLLPRPPPYTSTHTHTKSPLSWTSLTHRTPHSLSPPAASSMYLHSYSHRISSLSRASLTHRILHSLSSHGLLRVHPSHFHASTYHLHRSIP